MADLAYSTSAFDLVVERRDLRLTSSVLEEVAQRVYFALDMQRGQYVYDTRAGFPWRELVFVKAPNFTAIRAELRRVVKAADTRVLRVENIVLTLDAPTRHLTLSLDVVTEAGTVSASGSVTSADGASPTINLHWATLTGARLNTFPG